MAVFRFVVKIETAKILKYSFLFQIKNNRYFVATQDRELQDYLRSRPGQPLLYLHKKTPVLEQPSELSRKTVEFKMNDSFTFGSIDAKKLEVLKKTEGLPTDEAVQKPKKKHKKKQPNPLSCKKKKKKGPNAEQQQKKSTSTRIQSKTIEKKKRARIHVPAHVKEILSKTKGN